VLVVSDVVAVVVAVLVDTVMVEVSDVVIEIVVDVSEFVDAVVLVHFHLGLAILLSRTLIVSVNFSMDSFFSASD
jgi:hypothetical protein